jgi:unsaturated rhamnogalacturonyl hydrolase
LNLKVNFQPTTAEIPAGYLPDYGGVYGVRNGTSYGWSEDHTAVTRDRNLNADQRLDTICHFLDAAKWELALPNGSYDVKVSVGDAGFASSHTINVEGVSYWNAVSLAANQFVQNTKKVSVGDGRLTIDCGSSLLKQTRINYVEVTGGTGPTPRPTLAPTSWAVRFADSILQKWPNPTSLSGSGWEYNNGIILHGIEEVYKRTKNSKYLQYLQTFVNAYTTETGSVSFTKTADNLDHLQPGILLLLLYEETGLNRYRLAANTIRNEFNNQPRNAEGGFWHKAVYPNQMWVDGIYMAEPFLIKYGTLFGEQAYCQDEATFQATLLASHAQNASTGLLYHGWDSSKNAAWANPLNGLSPEYWNRGDGWYVMALVDILEYLPTTHPRYSTMLDILRKLVEGIKKVQDPVTGLWFQVLDKGNLSDNWLESSGSGMFVYAIKKAIDKGYVDTSYLAVAQKGWQGMQTMITLDTQGLPVIHTACTGTGVQTSYQNYINRSTSNNSSHGYCGILLAASQME